MPNWVLSDDSGIFRPSGTAVAPVSEAKAVSRTSAAALTPATTAQVRRTGYEYGIPLSHVGTSAQVAATSERQQILDELYQAYMTCNWVSAPIDLIARTVTGGGLQIVANDELPADETPPEPPVIDRLRRLLKFTNPREDLVQLLRCACIDLLLFGDAYLEIVALLGEPVALYTLDATGMTVISDQHGEVSGYRQDVDGVRSATFTPDQVIHISLDAPRGGLYGVSPTQKALLPITAWLYTEATIKECFRRGDPPRIHVDLAHFQDNDVQRWREQYTVNNLGPRAVGTPVITTGGGQVGVLDGRKVTDYLDTARQLRDEIISAFGCTPSKLGIIETGNIGAGTGESQDRTFHINTVIPIANLILEKLNYHIVQQGFAITDFHLEFPQVDYRDSEVVEKIREQRLKFGAFTVNDWRNEIGKPPIEGGDTAIIDTRTGITAWTDMEAMSKASIANKVAPLSAAGVNGYVPEVPDADLNRLGPSPSPVARFRDKPDQPVRKTVGPTLDAPDFPEPRESAYAADARNLAHAWDKAYRARRKAALKELPDIRE